MHVGTGTSFSIVFQYNWDWSKFSYFGHHTSSLGGQPRPLLVLYFGHCTSWIVVLEMKLRYSCTGILRRWTRRPTQWILWMRWCRIRPFTSCMHLPQWRHECVCTLHTNGLLFPLAQSRRRVLVGFLSCLCVFCYSLSLTLQPHFFFLCSGVKTTNFLTRFRF